MKNILFTIKCDNKLKQTIQASISKANIIFKNKKEVTIEDIKNIDAVIGNINKDLLKNSGVEWLHLESAGSEKYIDIDERIHLTNSTGAYGEAISEYMLTGVLTFYKRFNEYQRNQIYHKWDYLGKVSRLANSKVLVVGLGDIGLSFAKKMRALNARVYGVKRRISEGYEDIEALYTFDNIANIIGECDIVAISLPSTKATKNIFDYKLLKMMKKDAVLINVGRGDTLDTDALIRVLDEGYFKGVLLDVTNPEPLPVNNKLWRYPNVIITPHVSGNYSMDYTYERVIEIALDNINKYINNEKLNNLVDRKTGYKD